MKKIYYSIAFLAFSTMGFAQGSIVNAKVDKTTFERHAVNSKPITNTIGFQLKTVVLTEDFESVTAPDLPVGWSTSNGMGDSCVWYSGDAAAANAGGYWPIPSMPDGSPSSLFAMANDDVCNSDMSQVYLQLPDVDFTGLSNMSISYHAFDDGTYGGVPHEVEVSIDGGANWSNIYTGTFDAGAWQSIIAPLGASTDNKSQVSVRFKYNDNGTWATGTAIDNVVISEIFNDNITVNSVKSADIDIDYEYSIIPLSQARPVALSVDISNNGLNDQSDVSFDYDISDASGSVSSGSSSVVSPLNSFARDTIIDYTPYTPSAIGEYTVTATATMSATDLNTTDNTMSTSFTLSENIWAKDLYESIGIDGSFGNISGNSGNPCTIGHLFFPSAAATAYSVDIGIGSQPYNENSLFYGTVFKYNVSTQEWDQISNTADYMVQASDLGQIVSLPLFVPVELDVASTYKVTGGHYGPSAGDPTSDCRIACSGPGVEGDVVGDYNSVNSYYLSTPPSPIVRLNFTDISSINEESLNFSLKQNQPNPFKLNTNIAFELMNSSKVSLKVNDNNGRLIEEINLGLKPAGSHNITFDGSKLTSGLYYYTLSANNESITKSMIFKK